MGLNLKDIPIHLCKVIQVSIDNSCKFIQRHPLLSSAFLVLFILYLFLSYIYSFLVYLSPFLLCAAILIRVFWSSEQTQIRNGRRDEIKIKDQQNSNEQRYSKIPRYERYNTVPEKRFKYSSQRALSRRRNFRDKRWELENVVDEKSKPLSAACNNNNNIRVSDSGIVKKECHSSGKEEGSSDSAANSGLRSQRSMSDLVDFIDSDDKNNSSIGCSVLDNENIEDGDDEDEEEAQEDRNKAVEWTEDDQKNLMDLGLSEIERNRRLESLIARRRARKLLKLQIEKGLIDIRNITPAQLAPLFISSRHPFDPTKDFDHIDELEMPGSAPSVLPPSRNPFDLPYDPSEEKPILTGDSFDQEFTIFNPKDMTYCRHESFSLGPSNLHVESKHDQGDREAYTFFFNGRKASDKLRLRRPQDKGNHDWLIEQLFAKGARQVSQSSDKHDESKSESEAKLPNPLKNKEIIKYEVGTESEKEITEIKGEGDEYAIVTKSMLEDTSEPDLMKNSNCGFAKIGQQIPKVETVVVSENPESKVHSPHSSYQNCLIPNVTSMHEPPLESFRFQLAKNDENVCYPEKRNSHTGTCSIASDLQVEVSEISSVDETITTTDAESVVYDGDIDKDIITSGSEDLGGTSFNSRGVHGIVKEDMGFAEVEKNLKDSSPILLEQTDEDKAADVSSGETPTHGINFGNTFGNVEKEAVVEIEEPQPLNSSDVSSPPKQLMDGSVDNPLHEAHSDNLEKGYSLEHFKKEAKVVDDVNDSAAIENDDTKNLQRVEDPAGTSNVQQGSVNEVSANSISSVSPRSILPVKTHKDQSSSSAFDVIQANVPESEIEDMTLATPLTTPSGQHPAERMLQNMQYFMTNSYLQSYYGVFSNFQDDSSSEIADDASTSYTFNEPIFDEQKMDGDSIENILRISLFGDVEENITSEIPSNKEIADSPEKSNQETHVFDKDNDVLINDKEDKVTLKFDENNEDKSASVIRQEAGVEIPTPEEMTKLDNIDEKSRELDENKATTKPSKLTLENDNSTTTEDAKMSGSVTKDETILHQGNDVDDGEVVDIKTRQGIQVDLPNLNENEGVCNPGKAEDETDSINIPTIEEVPSDSLISESSSEVPKVNIENESGSLRQEAAVEPSINAQVTSSSSAEVIPKKHDKLQAQLLVSNQPTREKPNESSEEMSSQNESKEVVEAHREKAETAIDSFAKDLPQPTMTEVSNLNSAQGAEVKSNEMNKKESIAEELEKNEAVVSAGEVDNSTNITHVGEPGKLVQLERSEGEESKKLVEGDKDSSQPTETSPAILKDEANKGHAES
ncbi:hypothetical protein L6164_028594 [Bauhinia variegata]|uniref:Uncharacterized protein n=1 Tax=Bauhinia variegata TaxID=167791 RepID=A0ACB9L6Y8_BAUVA|nr:hypothetical protein L6164_028594 [Bauhinia variegata]